MGTEPGWVEHAIWWHVYPLGFTGADPTGADTSRGRGLRALVDWLDYAVSLGVSGFALGPIFASSSHGYDTADWFRIDPRLGDEGDFRILVEEAHRRGLKIMLDGVFNHVGSEFPLFRQALAGGGGDEWFRITRRDGAEPDWETFEGHQQLVALNHDNPAVADQVVEVMRHWLQRGADAWRLDAAYAVPPRFWQAVLPRVRAARPDVYVVGEVIHGDYAATVAESGMDAVTQYELWKAIWSSLNEVNLFELAWAFQRHNGFLDEFVPLTFVGNHDVTRIASKITDARHLAHALVVLFTVGGTPSVYYGDEQGYRGTKEERAGGDDEVRPPFPGRPDDLSELGAAVYRLHQELIALRRRNPWLHAARTAQVELRNEQLVYDVSAGADRLRVALNLADEPLAVAGVIETVAGVAPVEQGHATVHPHGWAVLRPS